MATDKNPATEADTASGGPAEPLDPADDEESAEQESEKRGEVPE